MRLPLNSIAHLLTDAVCAAAVFGPIAASGGDLSLCIVIYNSAAFLTQCLAGLMTDLLTRHERLAAIGLQGDGSVMDVFETVDFITRRSEAETFLDDAESGLVTLLGSKGRGGGGVADPGQAHMAACLRMPRRRHLPAPAGGSAAF